jgi:hypothetical protein
LHLSLVGRFAVAVTVCAVSLAGTPVHASAAGSGTGVHVDPGSPAGYEYAIPLDQARVSGGGGGSVQLFGAGIAKASPPPSTAVGSTVATGPDSPPAGGGHVRRRAASNSGRTRLRSAESLVARQTSDISAATERALGGGQAAGLRWMALSAAGVLGLGLLIGVALGRRSRKRTARVG